jgi:hypothetical protein
LIFAVSRAGVFIRRQAEEWAEREMATRAGEEKGLLNKVEAGKELVRRRVDGKSDRQGVAGAKAHELDGYTVVETDYSPSVSRTSRADR